MEQKKQHIPNFDIPVLGLAGFFASLPEETQKQLNQHYFEYSEGIIKTLYEEVCKENETLHEKLARSEDRKNALADTAADYKNKLDQMTVERDKYKALAEGNERNQDYDLMVCQRTFSYASRDSIERLWNHIYNLTQDDGDKDPFIKLKADAVVVFQILKNGSMPVFTGTYLEFMDQWNHNIANRMADLAKRDQLMCKVGSFKTMLYREPYSINPTSWESKSYETTEHRKTYDRIIKILKDLKYHLPK